MGFVLGTDRAGLVAQAQQVASRRRRGPWGLPMSGGDSGCVISVRDRKVEACSDRLIGDTERRFAVPSRTSELCPDSDRAEGTCR
jgi:hypothetical protein